MQDSSSETAHFQICLITLAMIFKSHDPCLLDAVGSLTPDNEFKINHNFDPYTVRDSKAFFNREG